MLTPLVSSLTNPIPALTPAAWYRWKTGITVTGSGVAVWADQSGNGRNLLQGTDGNRPAYNATTGELTFNGTSSFMQTAAFTLNQPNTVYLVCKQVTWTDVDTLYDGISGRNSIGQSGVSPALGLYAGSGGVTNSNSGLTVGSYGIVTAIFNAASSILQINAGTPATGTTGTNAAGGITLGSYVIGDAYWANIIVKELIAFAAAHNASQRALVQRWLNYVHHVY